MTVIWCMVPQISSAMDKIFCHFGLFFALLPPNNPKNQNFGKMKKNIWRYYNFTYVYHKWQWYDVWFLRYGAWRTKFFVILDCFLPFYSSNNPKNQNFEKIKKAWRYYHFTYVYHKWQSYNVCFQRYAVWQTEFFVTLDHFLPFYPPNNPKNQNFQKRKRTPEDNYHFTNV